MTTKTAKSVSQGEHSLAGRAPSVLPGQAPLHSADSGTSSYGRSSAPALEEREVVPQSASS